MPVDAKRAQAVFLEAVEAADTTALAALLDRECATELELRHRVEALLQANRNPARILAHPAILGFDATLSDAQDSSATHEDTPRATPEQDGDLTQNFQRENHDEESGLEFLEPSAKPGALGRLGHYEVLEVVGRGGFGVVLKAFDEVLRRVVAIKMMLPQMAASSPNRKRFLREARASAAVRHDNVVQIYAVEEKPIPYLVMEFIPGETLEKLLDRTGPVDVRDVLRIGSQVARGLAAAHEMGLVHRDIKPANILLESGLETRAKLTDFGLARADDDASLTQSGMLAGTPMYMAPEQARGEHVDQRADLFSLGSLLYVMASGQPPFRAANTLAVLKRVNEDTARPIPEIIPEVPQVLCDIITKLHAKDPAERFPSARAVADILFDCLTQLQQHSKLTDLSRISAPVATGGPPVEPTSAPADRQASRPSLRKRSTVGVWAALIFGALLIGGGAYAIIELIFNTPNGRIIVQIEGDDIEARFKNGKIELYDQDEKLKYTLEPSERNKEIPAGKYGVKVAGVDGLRLRLSGADGLEVETDKFEMKRGGKVIVRVLLEPIVVATNPKKDSVRVLDANGRQQAAHLTEILTSPDWEWTVPENLGPAVNSVDHECCPKFSGDGRRLWFQRSGINQTDKAWISDRETPDKPWSPAKSVGAPFEFKGPMADMFISRDEQTWLFVTWDSVSFSQQIFESTRSSRLAKWSDPKSIDAAGSPAQFPVLSEDGLTLYLTNGARGDGLYVMSRPQTTARWSDPIRLENPVNSGEGVRAVWTSSDGLVLVFHSVRGNPGGAKHFDLWLTTRPSVTEPWQEPISFGPTINSSANERGACLSDDGRELVFESDRPGGFGASDLYVSRRVAKQGATAGPVLPTPPQPADYGLTIHDPQWKLIQVLRPEGKLYSTRFDRDGRLCFSVPERSRGEQSLQPGIYRVKPDGTHDALAQNEYWEFAFSPDEQRCFAHRGTMGVIAEIDMHGGTTVRELDMSPSDDGPTSPFFAPPWYSGTLVEPNEYLFADFGGRKRGPPSTGGIWKFGQHLDAPVRVFAMPEGESRLHALTFGRDKLFVAGTNGTAGRLSTFDGQTLVDLPTETLPVIGSIAFDSSDGNLLASEFDGHQVLRIDLSRPDQPASVTAILSGVRKLNFGVLSLSHDGRRLVVVDFDAGTISVLERTIHERE